MEALRGRVEQVEEGQVLLAVGPCLLRALASPLTAAFLREHRGAEVTVYACLYLQGYGVGTLEPVLLVFASAEERALFRLLLEVEGMGPRAALRALAEPVPAIAGAIARGDTAWLQRLPGVGRQRAAELVAKLQEKVRFLAAGAGAEVPEPVPEEVRRDVLAVLAQLGYAAREAEELLQQAVRTGARDPEELLRAALRAARPGAAERARAEGGMGP